MFLRGQFPKHLLFHSCPNLVDAVYTLLNTRGKAASLSGHKAEIFICLNLIWQTFKMKNSKISMTRAYSIQIVSTKLPNFNKKKDNFLLAKGLFYTNYFKIIN